MSELATIRFEPTGRTVEVPVGSTLLSAARLAGVDIDGACGGLGRCGSCRVSARGALTAPSAEEQELLGGAGSAAGLRLACRTRVDGDAVVEVPARTRDARVVTASHPEPLEVEPPVARGIRTSSGTPVGAVVDLGTTNVAVMVVDLTTGESLAVAGDTNSQRTFGADVLTRVAHASAGGGRTLQRVSADQIGELLGSALARAGIPADRLAEMVVVGNTAMTGLFLGVDVSSLGQAPYEGAPLADARVPAPSIGLTGFEGIDVLVPPGISAFVGSDITAGLLATGLAERRTPTLFIDLGTNGELVVASAGEILAASAAAGPALEGAAILCGMRAEPGAIESVTLMGDSLELGVIGDTAPVGICGSGLLDLVAALLDAGLIDATGRMVDSVPGPLGERLTQRHGVRAFVVDAGGAVVLTQKDVRAVQLAVGAVRTGIELLLAEAGMTSTDIACALLAGGFGYHVRAPALVRVGLMPAEWVDRVAFAGNTALAGGRMYLVNAAQRRKARELAARVRTVDLAAHPGFRRRFLEALDFPAPAASSGCSGIG